MMKLSDIFLFTIILLVGAACQQVELPQEPETGARPNGPEFTAQVELFGSADHTGAGSQGAQTKTVLAAEKSVVWSAGDQIAIFQGTSAADKYQVKEDGVGKTSGTFAIVAKSESADGSELQTNIAIYPYEEDLSCSPIAENDAVTAYQITGVTIPSTQTYTAGSFADYAFPMAAITNDLDDHTLRFKNLCGVLRLQLKGTAKVKTIELRGNDNEPLSGDATVTVYPDGTAPTIEMSSEASKTITLDCSEGIQLNETTATDFLIAIPPTAFEKGFNIIVTDIEGGKAQTETSKTNAIGRSYIHTMPEIVVGTNHIVPKSKEEPIKILCFGSSWFLNTWWYLNKITADLGIKAEIHGYYVGHSCFDEWIALYNNDLSPFMGSESTRRSYRYVSVDGENYSSSKRVSGGEYGDQEYRDDWYDDLTAGNWDIIAFQQGAHQSPKWEYWQNGDELVSLIRKHAGPETVIAFNNTWTPSITSSYLPGDTDGKCSKTLEGQILWQTMNNDNCKRFINLTGLNTISPNGAMLYTLRRDSMINIDGDDLCYDGLHPNHGLPMFALASVFYETYIAPFYGISINGCTWLPESSDKRGPFNNSVFRPVSHLQKERIYQYVHMSLDNRFGFNEPLPPVEEDLELYKPDIELGAISKQGLWAKNFYGKQYYRTPHYMKVTDSTIGVKAMEDCDVRVCQYDKDFNFIKVIDFSSVASEAIEKFALNSSCEYIRLCFRKSSSLPDFELPEVYVQNVETNEYLEVRYADDGFQNILIPVEVGGELLSDYGIMRLPETYSNVGEPTRLIIYCHGAGLNYNVNTTGFTGLDPEYFLAEGYAVMDMDGNPYDNSNTHGYISPAKQSYIAAYEWVVANYNIKTDGVFLAGRSMGGGMCFELLQTSIPVIAACPCVPVCNTLWWWNYMNSTRKSFCASKMGLTGTVPTWTSSKKLSEEEYQYLYDNYDKLYECSPFWRGIETLPDKDQLFSVGRVSASTVYDEAENNLYSSLSFKSKAPVKIFTCYEDTTVPYQRNAQLMYNMLKNAGVECELSLVHTDASTPHSYELNDSNAYIEVTTSSGETMQAPWVYVDMLEFWRKFE